PLHQRPEVVDRVIRYRGVERTHGRWMLQRPVRPRPICAIRCVELSSARVVQGGMSAPPAQTGLAHAYLLDGRGGGAQLDWAGIERWTAGDGTLWLNLDYSAPDAARWLSSNIAPLVRDALLDDDPRPRAVPHGDALLLIVRAINLNQGAEPEDML